MERIKVLLIKDNPGDARIIQDMLVESTSTEFIIDWKQTLRDGLEILGGNHYDAVLLDLGLPDSPQRSTTFTRVQSTAPTLPIIILTGLDDDSFAVSTVRRGAQDYLVKGKIDTNLLVRTIHYAIARRTGGERTFTIIELARYDGKEGRSAYVAFEGKIYDSTGSGRWKNGIHGLKHQAGKDLTEAFLQAPH
jgi:predicted heme/steroid binding protein/CheY-like chemotaxis protein